MRLIEDTRARSAYLVLLLAVLLAGDAWRYAFGWWAWAVLVAFLLLVHAGNLLGPPPPGPGAIAWVGQAQWLLVLWAFWADNHRRPATLARTR